MKKATVSLIALLRNAHTRDLPHLRYPWADVFARVSGVKADKVEELRKALSEGTWRPCVEAVAQRLLEDHLLLSSKGAYVAMRYLHRRCGDPES